MNAYADRSLGIIGRKTPCAAKISGSLPAKKRVQSSGEPSFAKEVRKSVMKPRPLCVRLKFQRFLQFKFNVMKIYKMKLVKVEQISCILILHGIVKLPLTNLKM